MPKTPAAANSQPTFLRLTVKGMLLVAVVAALAGIATAADTPTRKAATLAVGDPPPGNFVGITPVRVLDTREPIGVPTKGPIPPDTTINVPVAGTNGIPANATAVAANVAIDSDAKGGSFVTVWPTGQPRPLTAANNATPGLVSASAGIFQLGDNGQLSVYNSQADLNVIIDVTGYYLPANPTITPIFGRIDVLPTDASGDGLAYITGDTPSLGTRVQREMTWPNTSFTAQNLHVFVLTPPGIGHSWTFTLELGGSDTALSCTIGGISVSCVSTNTVPITNQPIGGMALSVTTSGNGLPAAIATFGWQAAEGHRRLNRCRRVKLARRLALPVPTRRQAVAGVLGRTDRLQSRKDCRSGIHNRSPGA